MLKELRAEVNERRRHHYASQRWWSFAHHTSTLGAGILSLFVAALAQVGAWTDGFVSKNVLITILSTCVGAATLAGARCGFQRKWIANRETRSKLDQLQNDMLEENKNPVTFKDRLNRIIAEHDAAILGMPASGTRWKRSLDR